MAEYNFITRWQVQAPVEKVWELIEDLRSWPRWWRGVLEVHEIKNPLKKNGTCFKQTWRSIIPYKLKFETEVIAISRHDYMEARVTGELEGTGLWKFEVKESGTTEITYFWHVHTKPLWMNLAAPFLSGMFRWNHDAIMRWGGEGIARKLNCEVRFESSEVRSKPASTP